MPKIWIAGFAVLLLVLLMPTCGAALASSEDGIVRSYSELIEEIELGAGSLKFGADIVVPAGEWLDLYNTYIDTGEYSLIVDGYLFLWPGAVISGSGTSGAVVEIRHGGGLQVLDASYDDAPVIAATGIDTGSSLPAGRSGGVALTFREGAWYFSNASSFLNIYANDGIGILSEIPLDLIFHFIYTGNGRGIVSNEAVNLFLCRIEGGVDAPAVIADTSVLIPHNSVETIQRQIHALSPNRTVLDLGEPLPYELVAGGVYYTAVTYSAPGFDDKVLYQNVTLDVSPIDIGKPGEYPVYLHNEAWMGLCGLLPSEQAPYTVVVRDLSIPVFQHLDYMPGGFGLPATAWINYRYNGSDADTLILWRSDDEGESWQDATDTQDFDLWDGVLTLVLWSEEHPVWLVWEVPDVGESEILIVTFDGDGADGNPGGDRSGIDRKENSLPPEQAGNNEPDGGQQGGNTEPDGGRQGGNTESDGGRQGGNTEPGSNQSGELSNPPDTTYQETVLPSGQPDAGPEAVLSVLAPANNHSEPAAVPGALNSAVLPEASSAQMMDATVPYRDSYAPILIAGAFGLAAAVYFCIEAKRRARRHG